MITHGQLVSQCKSLMCIAKVILPEKKRHIYVTYLPLAHMFEFIVQLLFFGSGVRMGYASAMTLIEGMPGLKPNEPSDLALLKPTLMIAVPLVLDRLRRGVTEQIDNKPLAKAVFNQLISYKDFWRNKGYTTPITNFFLSRKAKSKLGSNMQYMLVGGAPVGLTPSLTTALTSRTGVDRNGTNDITALRLRYTSGLRRHRSVRRHQCPPHGRPELWPHGTAHIRLPSPTGRLG